MYVDHPERVIKLIKFTFRFRINYLCQSRSFTHSQVDESAINGDECGIVHRLRLVIGWTWRWLKVQFILFLLITTHTSCSALKKLLISLTKHDHRKEGRCPKGIRFIFLSLTTNQVSCKKNCIPLSQVRVS